MAGFSPSYRGITFVAPGVDILSTVSHDNIKVNSVYYKSKEGYIEFCYSQIDNGNFEYSSTLPTVSSCYYNLSDNAVTEHIIEKKLSVTSKREIQNASRICESEGGSLLVDHINHYCRAV